MADLRTRYLGLELQSPLVASSSPLTGNLDGLRRLEAAGAGAVVLPSLFEEELAEGAPRPGAGHGDQDQAGSDPDVGRADQAEGIAPQRQCAFDTQALSFFNSGLVDQCMHSLTTLGVQVVVERLLERISLGGYVVGGNTGALKGSPHRRDSRCVLSDGVGSGCGSRCYRDVDRSVCGRNVRVSCGTGNDFGLACRSG